MLSWEQRVLNVLLVFPTSTGNKLQFIFPNPAEIRSSLKDTMCINNGLSSSDWYYALISLASAFLSMAVIIMKLSTKPHFKQNTLQESVNSIYYFVHLEPAKLICTISTIWAIPVRSKRLMTIKLVLLGRQLQTNHKWIRSGPTGPFTQKLQNESSVMLQAMWHFRTLSFHSCHARLELIFCKVFNPK